MRRIFAWLLLSTIAQSVVPLALLALLFFRELPKFSEVAALLVVVVVLTVFYTRARLVLTPRHMLWIALTSSALHAILVSKMVLWSWGSPTIGIVAIAIALSLLVICSFNGVAYLIAMLIDRTETATMKTRSRWLTIGLASSVLLNVGLLLYGAYVSIDTGVTITYMSASLDLKNKNLEAMAALLEQYASNATQVELEQRATALALPIKIESQSEMWVGEVLLRFEGGRLSEVDTSP